MARWISNRYTSVFVQLPTRFLTRAEGLLSKPTSTGLVDKNGNELSCTTRTQAQVNNFAESWKVNDIAVVSTCPINQCSATVSPPTTVVPDTYCDNAFPAGPLKDACYYDAGLAGDDYMLKFAAQLGAASAYFGAKLANLSIPINATKSLSDHHILITFDNTIPARWRNGEYGTPPPPGYDMFTSTMLIYELEFTNVGSNQWYPIDSPFTPYFYFPTADGVYQFRVSVKPSSSTMGALRSRWFISQPVTFSMNPIAVGTPHTIVDEEENEETTPLPSVAPTTPETTAAATTPVTTAAATTPVTTAAATTPVTTAAATTPVITTTPAVTTAAPAVTTSSTVTPPPAVCNGALKADPYKEGNYPKLDTTEESYSFHDNKFSFDIVGPVVSNRTYANVTFSGATSSSCDLHSAGSLWTYSGNTSCVDRFQFVINWMDHAKCGFARTASASVYEYKATLALTYFDRVQMEGMDQVVTRKTSVGYNVFVKFPRKISIEVTEVIVQSVVDTKFALTQFEMDADQHLSLTFATFLNWPNMFVNNTFVLTTPANVTQVAGSKITVDNTHCANTPNSRCMQSFHVLEQLTSGCTYNGEYTLLVDVVTCRENIDSCTRKNTTISFTIASSDVCGQASATPYVAGSLIAVEDDSANAAPIAEGEPFYVGTIGYFKAVLDLHEQANTVYLKFTEITMELSSDSTQKVTLMKNSASTPAGDKVSLTVNNNLNVNTFNFYMDSATFSIEPADTKLFLLKATASVRFESNNKRSAEERAVNFVWEASTAAGSKMSVSKHVNIAKQPQDITAAKAVPTTTITTTSVGVIVGCIILSVATVLGVSIKVVRGRSKNNSYSAL